MVLFLGSALALILIFLPFLLWGRRLLRSFRSLPRDSRFAVAIILSWQAVQLCIQYPGLVSGDDVQLWESTLRLSEVSAWHSLTYSFVSNAWAWVMRAPFHLSLVNLAFFSLMVFMTFQILPVRTHRWTLAGLTFILCLPQSSALVLFQNRDSLHSILILWLFLGILAQKSPARDEPWFRPWTLLVLGLILGDLRQEGKFLLILAPLALWWARSGPPRELSKFLGAMLISGAVLYGIPSRIPSLTPYSPSYRSTAFINPLSFIFHARGPEAATPGQIQSLEKMFRVQDLIEDYTPYDIGPFHSGKYRDPPLEDYPGVERAAREIIWKNRDLFLENRLQMAASLLNFRDRPMAMHEAGAFPSKLAEAHFRWMSWVIHDLPWSLHYFLSSFLVPLLTLTFSLSLVRARPEVFSAAVVNLVRLGIVILLTPANYFKYVTSSWVFGWILFFLLIETRSRSRIETAHEVCSHQEA